jgi:transcriptional regulator with XRE-family HTH domain
MVMSTAKGSATMGAERDYGRKRPNGSKIVELRKGIGLKQEKLAEDAEISVRRLRDIERKNYAVPTTIITAIAVQLKVTSADITLSTPDTSATKARPLMAGSLLKLQAVCSATKLSALARQVNEYRWWLKIDPNTATATDMQAVMTTVHRLVHFKYDHQLTTESKWWDEFDGQPFGQIPRLARLQDLLTRLGTNGVNVIAGAHTYSTVRNLAEREPPDSDEVIVHARGTLTKQAFKYVTRLEICFAPCDVEEEVISIYTGPSREEFEFDDDDEIPF